MSDRLGEIIDAAMQVAMPPRRAQGKPRELHIAFSRELNERDLEALNAAHGGLGVASAPVLRIRNTHHSIARLLAEGVKPVEISAITGYTPGRISVLQADPAFKELLAHYQNLQKELWIDVQARLKSLGITALEEITQRLEDEPDQFKTRELMDILQITMDRTGNGPSAKVTHLHGHFSEDLLRAVKDEAASRSRGRVTTLEAVPALAHDPGVDLGGTESGPRLLATESAGSGEKGDDV